MAVFETWLKNDLKKPVSVKQLSGNLFSADNGGNLIGVEVTDDGSPASLSGSVYGYVIRADGATVVVQGSLSSNKASITLPTSCYAVVGQISIVIKVGTTTVGACVGYVYRTTTDTIVDPGSVVPSLSELLQKIADCEAATAAATAAGYVNIAMSKTGNVITIVTTNNQNQQTTKTITEPTATVTESNGTITVTVTDAEGTTTVSFTPPAIDDTAGAGDATKVWSADKSNAEITGLKSAKADVIDVTISTPSAIVTFADGANGLPMALKVGIEPVQAGSGDPSPSNVRPISGWTGAKVANISDSEKQPYFADLLNGTYGFVDLGSLDWTYITSSSKPFFTVDLEPMKLRCPLICAKYTQTNYAPNNENAPDNSIYNNGYFSSPQNVIIYDSAYTDAATFKTAMSGVYLVYELATPTTPTITKEQFDALLEEFGIEGWLVPISWQSEAGTVYGGTLTLNQDGTGSLVVDRAYDRASPSSTWNYGTTSAGGIGYCYCPSTTIKRDYNKLICSHFKTVSTVADVGISVSGGLSTGQIQFYVDALGIESASEFVTFLTNNEVYYTYALATPVAYTLTAPQVKTILGLNNVWADTGDILSVDYPADTKLYIDGKFASLQALILENISNT